MECGAGVRGGPDVGPLPSQASKKWPGASHTNSFISGSLDHDAPADLSKKQHTFEVAWRCEIL